MRIFYVHGYNVADRGAGTVGVLRERFPGKIFRYGRASLWDVYVANGNLSEALFSEFEYPDEWEDAVFIGHSNGCAIINAVLKMGKKEFGIDPLGAIYIAPALNAGLKSPLAERKIHVLHSYHDHVVRLASWLPALIWGRMGNRGARSDGYANHDCTGWARGHSHYFHIENQPKLFAIVRDILESSDQLPTLGPTPVNR